jgi:hypothetical protein
MEVGIVEEEKGYNDKLNNSILTVLIISGNWYYTII